MIFNILTFLSAFIITSGTFLEFSIVSDESSWVFFTPTLSEGNAVTYTAVSGWTTNLLDASWIGGKNSMNAVGNSTITKFFYIAGSPNSGTLNVAADDYFTTYMNDNFTNFLEIIGTYNLAKGKEYNVLPYLVQGLNKIVFEVKNAGGSGGLMFRLGITSIL